MPPCVAPIAQLVEHFIRNEGVFGSNPDWGTRITNRRPCDILVKGMRGFEKSNDFKWFMGHSLSLRMKCSTS